jgi:hypothetical protein
MSVNKRDIHKDVVLFNLFICKFNKKFKWANFSFIQKNELKYYVDRASLVLLR